MYRRKHPTRANGLAFTGCTAVQGLHDKKVREAAAKTNAELRVSRLQKAIDDKALEDSSESDGTPLPKRQGAASFKRQALLDAKAVKTGENMIRLRKV